MWMEQYHSTKGLLVIPTFLLVEVAASISRLTGESRQAKETVRQIVAINIIQIVGMDNELIQATVDIAADLRLRAGDAIYVAVAHRLNIPLISWDREQVQKAGTLVAA
jgi:predicted nucleic acid-binding protein